MPAEFYQTRPAWIFTTTATATPGFLLLWFATTAFALVRADRADIGCGLFGGNVNQLIGNQLLFSV